MSEYTPAFQTLLDACEAKSKKSSIEDIRAFFYVECQRLGPWERLQNMYRIRPKRAVPGEKSRLVFFTPNKMQAEFWKNHTNRDLVLKMRQGGVTTFSCLIALDLCLWTPGVHTAIMAHVKELVKKYFRITTTAFKAFQEDWGMFYPVSKKVDNVNELQIKENNSSLTVCTECKGLTLDFLHIAEAAFVPDDRISESLEAVPLSGWAIMETTPDTATGLFYELWDIWERGDMCTFKGHFFEWWYQYPEPQDIPFLKTTKEFVYSDKEQILASSHDLSREHVIWRRLKIAESGGDEGEFSRKYPEDPRNCWLSGASSVFPAAVLAALWRNERPPAFVGRLESVT